MGLRVEASLPSKHLSIQKYGRIGQPVVPVGPRFGEKQEKKAPEKGFWHGFNIFALGLELLAMGAAGGVGYHIYNDSKTREKEMVVRAQDKLDMNIPEEKWPENTKVYASTIQETNGYGDFFGFIYPRNLVSNLNDPANESLDAAHKKMENGLSYAMRPLLGFSQTAIASPVEAKGWNKLEDRPRFVLMIMGDPQGAEFGFDPNTVAERQDYDKLFMKEMSDVKGGLKENFRLPDSNIKQLIRPTGQELVNAMEWLKEMSDNNPDAEALVYVVAHGNSDPDYRLPKDMQDKQGAYIGEIGLNSSQTLSEIQMKYLFNQYLSGFKAVNLLMAPCHSGAWISKAEPPVKTGNPFAVPGVDKAEKKEIA